MGAASYRLRILHLSDLHMKGPREREPWRRRRVLGAAWEDNLATLLQDGPVDLVCFTGDAAHSGAPDEYEAASEFFTGLLDRLRLGREALFLVPGNHDIQQDVERDVWARLREAAPRADELELSRWMGGSWAPLGLDDIWRDAILERQATYRRWIREGLGLPLLDPAASPHGRLGYRVKPPLSRFPFPVYILGLDTAWLCGDDNDATRLRLTDSQLMGLATDDRGEPLTGLRIALLHHPFHELADGAACRKLLDGHIDLALRGHLHRPEIESGTYPDRNSQVLAAGCLFEGSRADHYVNAFQVITLELDPMGTPLGAEIRYRAFSRGGGHWYDDNSLSDRCQEGHLRILAGPAAMAPRTASPLEDTAEDRNPYDPWTPAVPPRFVGRADELRRLDVALEEGRSVSVVGDWRIGKTSLLDTWTARQEGRGRVVRRLTGEGPEGTSIQVFVEKVTGLRAGAGADEAADVLDRWVERNGRPGLPPLLAIDEFDGLLPRFEPRFFERMRGMLGRIVLVLASRRELDRVCEELGRTSPFHNRLELLWLGLLEPAAANELAGWAFHGEDEAFLSHWAGRHPFYLQLLGRHLVETRRQGNGKELALDNFRMEAAARLRELWQVLPEKDHAGLEATLLGKPTQRVALRKRGLVTEDGWPFGEVLAEWLREEL
jgi:predicted phosphodiesterase